MALFGALLLVFIIIIRPQEFLPALESLSILNVATAVALIGIVIEIGTGRVKSLSTPQLPFLAAFLVWCLVSTVLKVGLDGVNIVKTTVGFSALFMIIVVYSLTTFGRFRSMAVLLLGITLSLAAVGVHQSSSPFECIVLETDENGMTDSDKSGGIPNGVSCESYRDCAKEANDYKTEFVCEKPGLFSTYSVAHGRVRWRGTLADPNELSLAIGAAISFAFAIHASAKGKWRHLFLLGAVALASFCVVETESRGGVLVLLAIFGTYFLQRYGAKGLVLAAAFGAPVFLLGGRSGEEADSSALERLGALYEGVDFVRSNPILGLGVRQFDEHYFITAHNSYLLSAAELGFPGMLLWTCLVYVSVKIPYAVSRLHGSDAEARLAPYGFALMTSFAGILVGIFFLSFSYHPLLFIYFGLSGALFLAARRASPAFEVKVKGKEIGMLAGIDAALLLVLFVYTRIKGSP